MEFEIPKAVERPIGIKVGNSWKEIGHLKAICSESGYLYSIVNKNYELVQHEDVVKIVDEALNEMNVEPLAKRISYGKMYGKLFYKILLFQEQIKDDKVGFGILVTNSYDTSLGINVLGYGMNFTCLNQMVLGREILKIVTKHFRTSLGTNLSKVKDAVIETIDSLRNVADVIKTLAEGKISMLDVFAILDGLRLSKTAEAKVIQLIQQKTGIKDFGIQYTKYKIAKKKEEDLKKLKEKLKDVKMEKWTTYNVFTEYVTHHTRTRDYSKKFEMLNKVSAILVK